jgi:hypothetical protein
MIEECDCRRRSDRTSEDRSRTDQFAHLGRSAPS